MTKHLRGPSMAVALACVAVLGLPGTGSADSMGFMPMPMQPDHWSVLAGSPLFSNGMVNLGVGSNSDAIGYTFDVYDVAYPAPECSWALSTRNQWQWSQTKLQFTIEALGKHTSPDHATNGVWVEVKDYTYGGRTFTAASFDNSGATDNVARTWNLDLSAYGAYGSDRIAVDFVRWGDTGDWYGISNTQITTDTAFIPHSSRDCAMNPPYDTPFLWGPAPSGLVAATTGDQTGYPALSWNPQPGAASFNLYRDGAPIAYGLQSTSFVDYNPPRDCLDHHYGVTAVSSSATGSEESAQSAPAVFNGGYC